MCKLCKDDDDLHRCYCIPYNSGEHLDSLRKMLDEYVKEKVRLGLYNNASEVVREALRLQIATEETEEIKLQKLRDAIEPA